MRINCWFRSMQVSSNFRIGAILRGMIDRLNKICHLIWRSESILLLEILTQCKVSIISRKNMLLCKRKMYARVTLTSSWQQQKPQQLLKSTEFIHFNVHYSIPLIFVPYFTWRIRIFNTQSDFFFQHFCDFLVTMKMVFTHRCFIAFMN